MPPPVIAWLTDFGTRDHYVAVMKAVALTIAPAAAFIDITHDIAPQDVMGGALELDAAYRYFPAGTIFVTVVDPGVGSARRALAVQAAGFTFVAPDNGLLTPVLRRATDVRAVTLDDPRFALPSPSRTFEGRDRFAPAAAWLASGTALEALGPPAENLVMLSLPAPLVASDVVRGEIVRIDRFGNAVSNLSRQVLDDWRTGTPMTVAVGDRCLGEPVSTYADAPPGLACAMFGSTSHLEIAVPGGNAASSMGVARGTVVAVRRAVPSQ